MMFLFSFIALDWNLPKLDVPRGNEINESFF